jgi:transcriptional regulator with XRE-family HTH domain
MDSEKPLAGGVPMVSIDGANIRRIREEKGLTQLYVATVVGVTTDTISRWENKRYPNIKKENAVKLAEALETRIDEIIDHGPPAPLTEPPSPHAGEPPEEEESLQQSAAPEAPPVRKPAAPFAIVLLGAVLLLALVGLALIWRHTANDGEGQVEAIRTLPTHPQASPFRWS